MKDKVKIKVNTSLDFIKYLITHNIKYTNLIKENNTYTLITTIENYKKINRRFDTKLLRYYGMNFIKQNYINNNFNLLGANVKYFDKSYTDDEWGLENIEVKNTGTKNVKSFEITVYFKDAEGNNIAENTFNLYESIKANYSWKQNSSSYYELKNLAGEVDPSRNEIRITDIEFEA